MKLYDVIIREQTEEKKQQKGKIIEPPIFMEKEDDYVLPPKKRQTFSWRKIGIIAGSAIFLSAIYLSGMYLVRAKVVIIDRRIPFSIDGVELDLIHEDNANNDRLSFQSMVVSDEVTREVFGSNLKPSTSKAQGSIVFFNSYSKKTETVHSGAILIAANGEHYLTTVSAKVPGYTQSGTGKSIKKIPGTSTPITIIATDTGPSYNQNGTTFTVSGFASKTFYAQSASDITGGEDGITNTLNSDEQSQAVTTMEAQLDERLKRETISQIPSDLVTFPSLQFISIDQNSINFQGNGVRFPATMKGTMVSYLISRNLLEQAIAAKAISDNSYSDVTIPELETFDVEPTSPIPTDPNIIPDDITVTISGQGTIVTNAPLQSIKDAIVGQNRNNFSNVLSNIPEIDTASFNLYPFWAPFFPSKEKNITVIIQ